ncbi:hypothetical protein QBK93_36130 [Rhizobium leguminosarum]|nr:hypothetical protein [Rhizobium leguminosarum]
MSRQAIPEHDLNEIIFHHHRNGGLDLKVKPIDGLVGNAADDRRNWQIGGHKPN